MYDEIGLEVMLPLLHPARTLDQLQNPFLK